MNINIEKLTDYSFSDIDYIYSDKYNFCVSSDEDGHKYWSIGVVDYNLSKADFEALKNDTFYDNNYSSYLKESILYYLDRDLTLRDNKLYDEDDYRVCYDCGKIYPKDELTYVESEDEYICDFCLSNNFTECDDCGELFRNENLTYVDNLNLCEDCLEATTFFCEKCGELHRNDILVYGFIFDSTSISNVCTYCIEDYDIELVQCNDVEEPINKEYAHYCKENDSYYLRPNNIPNLKDYQSDVYQEEYNIWEN